jgi:hypothetical protein
MKKQHKHTIKILSALIIIILMTSCVKEKSNNQFIFKGSYNATGTLIFPNSGIKIIVNSDSFTWDCPAGTSVPQALLNNPTPFGSNFTHTIRCQNSTGCNALQSDANAQNGIWVNTFDINHNVQQGAGHRLANNSNDVSVMCVPNSQVNYWVIS